MSAYSDWKCGAITDDEYKSAVRREQTKCDDCEWLYRGFCTCEGNKPCEVEEEE